MEGRRVLLRHVHFMTEAGLRRNGPRFCTFKPNLGPFVPTIHRPIITVLHIMLTGREWLYLYHRIKMEHPVSCNGC